MRVENLSMKKKTFWIETVGPVYPYISIWIIKFLSLLDFVNWRRIIYFRLNRLWSTSPQSENSKWRWLFAEISHPTKKIRKEFRRLKILNFRDLNPRDFAKNGVVAQERHTEPRLTIERLLAKPRSFSNLPAFLDLYGTITYSLIRVRIFLVAKNG